MAVDGHLNLTLVCRQADSPTLESDADSTTTPLTPRSSTSKLNLKALSAQRSSNRFIAIPIPSDKLVAIV